MDADGKVADNQSFVHSGDGLPQLMQLTFHILGNQFTHAILKQFAKPVQIKQDWIFIVAHLFVEFKANRALAFFRPPHALLSAMTPQPFRIINGFAHLKLS